MSVLPSAPMPRGGKQPGAGRPPRTEPESPEDRPRNRTVSIYDSEWRDVTAAAARDGDTPGGWMRDLAVAVARGKVRIVREP